MRNFIETTMVIDEARATVKKRNFTKITAIFLLVYLASLLLVTCFAVVFALIYGIFNGNMASALMNSPEEIINSFAPATLFAYISLIIAPIIYCTRFERRRLFTMGFIKKNSFKEYFVGLLIGTGMFSIAYAVIYLCGGFTSVSINTEIPYSLIFLMFLGYIIQGLGEEVMLRGYCMVSLATLNKLPLAIFVSSALFTLLHVGNSNINFIGYLNIFLFGVFAALYFIRRGSIWGIAALHTAWNFVQGNIFGCYVSGINFYQSVFTTEIDNALSPINGGWFGPEGGLAVTAVLLVTLSFMKNKEWVVDYNI